MKKFNVNIREILETVYTVEAETEQEATRIINERYRNQEIILCPEDLVDTEISIVK